jgi:hypothetical protein
MFNPADVQAVVRSGSDSRYWQQVLRHCFDGGLQPVLDEYAHLLREQTAVVDDPPEAVVGPALRCCPSGASVHLDGSCARLGLYKWPSWGGDRAPCHGVRVRAKLGRLG